MSPIIYLNWTGYWGLCSPSQSAVQVDMGVLGGRVVAEDLG